MPDDTKANLDLNTALDNQAPLEEITNLIAVAADVNAKDEQGNAPLFNAIKHNRANVVKLLLEQNADVNIQNSYGDTPLHEAVRQSNSGMYQVIQPGIDYSARDKNRVEIIKLLMASGADINAKDSKSNTPLHSAIASNNVHLTKFLIENNANLEATDKQGNTPLLLAAKNDGASIIEFLLTKNAEVNVKNLLGYTPLHYVAIKGNKDVVQALIPKGANVDVKDSKGNTPLFLASAGSKTEIVKLLLKQNADVNIQNSEGDTSLHKATSLGDIELCKLLTKKGAVDGIKNINGLTAFDIALSRNDLVIMKHLKGKEYVFNKYIDNSDIEKIKAILKISLDKKDYEISDYIVKKIGINVFADMVKKPDTKQTIIYIQGPDHNGSLKKLSDTMEKLATKQDVNFLNIRADNKYIGLAEIKKLIQSFAIDDTKVIVVLGMHGSPALSAFSAINNLIKDYFETSSNFIDHFLPYHHMVAAYGPAEPTFMEQLFSDTNTATLLEGITLALEYKPYTVISESCYGALAAFDAYQTLPTGSQFIGRGEEPVAGLVTSPMHAAIDKLIDSNSDNNFSLDHILKISICIPSVTRSSYHYNTGIVTSDGVQLELKREAEKLLKQHFKFDSYLREKIHQEFIEVESICGSAEVHNVLDDVMNQMEQGSISPTNFNAMLAITKEALDIQYESAQNSILQSLIDFTNTYGFVTN